MSEKSPDSQKGFLTPLLADVFGALGRNSLYEWVLKGLGKESTPSCVEKWVLGWLALATLCFIASSAAFPTYAYCLIALVSAYRVLEILVYAANTVLFHSFIQGRWSPISTERYAILLLINYAEIILWFATHYSILRYDLLQEIPISVWVTKFMILRESMVIMVANSTGAFLDSPKSFGALVVVTIQIGIGLFMTLLVLARLVNVLPNPGRLNEKQ